MVAGGLPNTNTLELLNVDAAGVLEEAEAALDAARADRVADRYEQLATSVDSARASLRAARATASSDWETRYLEAEDRVLVTVRAYAEAADRLARAVSEQCIAVAGGDQQTSTPLPDQLTLCREEVARARRRRQLAATEVEAATVAAARVWASRPF